MDVQTLSPSPTLSSSSLTEEKPWAWLPVCAHIPSSKYQKEPAWLLITIVKSEPSTHPSVLQGYPKDKAWQLLQLTPGFLPNPSLPPGHTARFNARLRDWVLEVTCAPPGTGTHPSPAPASEILSLFLLYQPETHIQGDFESHVLKIAEPPDRKRQDPESLFAEEFSADQEYQFRILCVWKINFYYKMHCSLAVVYGSYSYPNKCSYCLVLTMDSVRNAFRTHMKALLHMARSVWAATQGWDSGWGWWCRVFLSDIPLPLRRPMPLCTSPDGHKMAVVSQTPIPGRNKKEEDTERMILITGHKKFSPDLLAYVSLVITESCAHPK